MTASRQSLIERALDACVGDDAERRVCEWVAKRISERRKQGLMRSVAQKRFVPFEVQPEIIFRELDGCDDSAYSKIFDALHKMSLHSIGLLDMRYEWHETDDVLAMPVPVEGKEVADAFRTGVMFSPVTGEAVRDFSGHVHVVYLARLDKDPYETVEE